MTDLTDIKISIVDVKVILGQDAYHVIRPLEYKSGDRDEPLADRIKKWWDKETYASVCDVSGRSKEEKRAQVILKAQHGITANVMTCDVSGLTTIPISRITIILVTNSFCQWMND